MNIGMMIIAIIGGLAGLLSTVYLVVSLPAVIIWKILRHFRSGCALTD
ncbi:MAG: hypothetical protein HFI51_10890 [Lachnospiraceae bacterium]|mgnify:FL=1|jgi:hypothetical protein|nr:hypothetical protein [Lachnospiraceae bacterium]